MRGECLPERSVGGGLWSGWCERRRHPPTAGYAGEGVQLERARETLVCFPSTSETGRRFPLGSVTAEVCLCRSRTGQIAATKRRWVGLDSLGPRNVGVCAGEGVGG